MKLLIVGGGGREHALAWAIRRELPAADLFCAPGNPGTSRLGTNLPANADDLLGLQALVERHRIDLTVIGPEAPLALGLADLLRVRGHRVFGPGREPARIESSKAWAKDVMEAAGVPTARSRSFTDFDAARAYIDRHDEPLVVKASGLAAGKGAVVCATRGEALAAAGAMLTRGEFGEAGSVVVVESFLEGEELSLLAITNGSETRLLPAAQDHKRLLDGDRGPNTGGMGAYSPVSLATRELLRRAESRVIAPTLAELTRRGAPFSGVLYAGLMIDPSGEPWVVEFNCRLGDPETQVILPRLEGGLVGALWAAATGEPLPELEVKPHAAVATVLAARGYPDRPEKGALISVPPDLPDGALLFHAGTREDPDGRLRVNGGRVFTVTGRGPTLAAAQAASRRAADVIRFEGKHFRSDIGWREAARLSGREVGA